MTQRERLIKDGDVEHTNAFTTQQIPQHVQTYDVPATAVSSADERSGGAVTAGRSTTAIIDRIRWGPVMAGLFTALALLAVLTLLGLAAGTSLVDTAADARRVAISTGIWTALSALLSFFAGGWVAARFAALRDERHALIHGALVWAVAVPLVLYLFSGGLDSLLNTASVTSAPTMDPGVVSSVADGVSKAAWGILASLLFGLSAAMFGGWVASRPGGFRTNQARQPQVARL